jgi:hypothetical protein
VYAFSLSFPSQEFPQHSLVFERQIQLEPFLVRHEEQDEIAEEGINHSKPCAFSSSVDPKSQFPRSTCLLHHDPDVRVIQDEVLQRLVLVI